MTQDLRQALRLMLKERGFTGVVVLTIALGIAATTTVFSVVHGVLLTELPYRDQDRLVMVWEHNVPRAQDRNVVSPANFFAWQQRAEPFESLAGAMATSATLTGEGEPERIGVMFTSASLFPMLGVQAAVGRLYTAAEDVAGAEPRPVVLGHGFWRRRFGGDPSVVGRTIQLNGRPAVVVGVMPERFSFELPFTFAYTGSQDVWAPLQLPEEASTATGRWLQVVGRLKPGVPVERAHASMTALAAQLEQEFPERQTGWTVNVVPLREQVVGDVERALLVIMGAVGFVLLIACANVANLLLARANDRQQEMAVRAALGAGRWRVTRQLLTESVMIAGAGGLVGLVLSYWALRALKGLGPDIPRLEDVTLNGPVLAFTVGVTVATGLLFGLFPALRVSRPDLAGALRERFETGRREKNRLRGALVVAEIALSLILLMGAGLLIRSFGKLLDTGVGFDPSGLLVAELQLPSSRYPEVEHRVRYFEELVDRVQALPGVRAAGAITFPPLTGGGSATSFWANDRPVPAAGEHPVADIRWVQRDYFQTLDIPLLAGRVFDERDRSDGARTVVISRATAETMWPGQSPLGKTISMPWGDTLVAEVIGVVGDIHHEGPATSPRSMLYWHHQQFQAFNQMSVVVRTDREPLSLASAVRGEVLAMDPELPVYNVRTMQSHLGDAVARSRFAMLAIGLFAAVALVLAAVGIYGMMSYTVGQRVHEIGIRMALGAEPVGVIGLVVRQGLMLVGIALVVGVAGALALSRLLESMVFGVGTRDPVTLAATSALLALVAVAACLVPALRASRVDPTAAMRME